MYLCSRLRERFRSRIGAGKPENLMAGSHELWNDRRTDETCSACKKNPHRSNSFVPFTSEAIGL